MLIIAVLPKQMKIRGLFVTFFGRFVNPISIRRADYAHHISLSSSNILTF